MRTVAAFVLSMVLLVVYVVTEHPLAMIALVVAAVVLAVIGLGPDRVELAPVPDPYRRQR